MLFIGLDGEMTSSELDKGGKLCQIGAVTLSGERFDEVIGWNAGEYLAESKAMSVHGISEQTIEAAARAAEVDEAFYAWLIGVGAKVESRGSTIPVGFNVGAFDLPFVRDALPKSATLISRRVVDLNAVVFTLGESKRVYQGSSPGSSGWKRLLKKAGAAKMEELGIGEAWHNAMYDAGVAIYGWDWVVKLEQ